MPWVVRFAPYSSLNWAMAAIGVWQIITPWVIAPDADAVVWSNVVSSGVTTVLVVAAAAC